MKKYNIHTTGLVFHPHNNGILCCEACGKLLGYVVSEHIRYLLLRTVCRCGTDGYMELGTNPPQEINGLAEERENHLECPSCKKPWFALTEEVRGYAFRVECPCGVCAETRRSSKRNVYAELSDMISESR